MKLKRLHDLREDADLTQAQVGKELNLPQRTYAYYKSGERTIPPEIIVQIAKLYNVSTDYIFELTDNPKPYYK